VRFVKGVGPSRAEALSRLGITTVRDLLWYLPRRYEPHAELTSIAEAQVGAPVSLAVEVVEAKLKKLGYRRTLLLAQARDATGVVELLWFNQPYYASRLGEGGRLLVTGTLRLREGRLQMVAAALEPLGPGEPVSRAQPALAPVYPASEEVPQKLLRRIVASALTGSLHLVPEMFPAPFRSERNLLDLRAALAKAHVPASEEEAQLALRRLKYEEFFVFETGLALRRRDLRRERAVGPIAVSEKLDARIRRLFPFRLTQAQERAIGELRADLVQPWPMNRLLQGDVGCGKTVVAVYALLAAVANHFQAALMAPTEILAEQHFRVLESSLRRARVRRCLLRGGMATRERAQVLATVAEGGMDIVVGTHALLQSDVRFANLGLVVIDEQHKFGVLERAALRDKGWHPHALVMTATPIPRTLTLTVFGDLDLSLIDEMPPGRGKVITRLVPPEKRSLAYDFIRTQLGRGRQCFVVAPLVHEGENDVASATRLARELQASEFHNFTVALVHGEMSAQAKDQVMTRFRRGQAEVLVATSVVEVGLDVPNATVLAVENAERFGLSALHQLRGRIGRGSATSHCLLFAGSATEAAQHRLDVLCETRDGFRIAEEDLRLRGPGEFFGTRQHGLPELRLGDILTDYELLRLARQDAFALVAGDPRLEEPEHVVLRRAVIRTFRDRLYLAAVG
jgi:ATP-dependent DNA helicase RecG